MNVRVRALAMGRDTFLYSIVIIRSPVVNFNIIPMGKYFNQWIIFLSLNKWWKYPSNSLHFLIVIAI